MELVIKPPSDEAAASGSSTGRDIGVIFIEENSVAATGSDLCEARDFWPCAP
jgi:hypothetical protein